MASPVNSSQPVSYASTNDQKSDTAPTSFLRKAFERFSHGSGSLKSASITLKAHKPIVKRLTTDTFTPPPEEEKTGWKPPLPSGPAPVGARRLFEVPEHCHFLRRFMFEKYGKEIWNNFAELSEYETDIKNFYTQELTLRKIEFTYSLEVPRNWILAESELEERDQPNLTKIMSRLVPMVRKHGYLKPPQSVVGYVDAQPLNCFEALWQMTREPRMLNKIEELNLSGLDLTEIPLSFARLYFSQVTKLSFANNRITELPKDIVEGIDIARKTYSFFSRYPNLKVLDFSDCLLSSIEGVFSFLSPSDNDMGRVHVLLNLSEAIFKKNFISALPKVFGISPSHLEKGLLIDISGNVVDSIEEETLLDLAAAAPTHITLNLEDDQSLYEFIQNNPAIKEKIPPNVSLITGEASHLLKTLKKEQGRS